MFPISVVSQKTGLTPEVLRAWERRYQGVRPQRDAAGRRVYSRELLDRLIVVARLLRAGYRVGDVVDLNAEELVERLEELAPSSPATPGYASLDRGASRESLRSGTERESVDMAVDAILSLNTAALRASVQLALTSEGRLEFADRFIFPVMRKVKALLAQNKARYSHLSFGRSNLRIIAGAILTSTPGETRDVILVATPVGYASDLGCLASATHIDAAGHTPIVLGAEVPAEDIVAAVSETGAAGVVMTFVSDHYDTIIYSECLRVREALAQEIPVYFGGRMPETLVRDLIDGGLIQLQDMAHLRSALSAASLQK
ncbi:MAG TPA: MerR family transcriptional regulator [Alkalispirochaeta sp.]|nr:MerR family transcriptional regulator [Alkalispirochaeta sp.]